MFTEDMDLKLWEEVPGRIGFPTLDILREKFPGFDFLDLDVTDDEAQKTLRLLFNIWLWFNARSREEESSG